MPSLLLLLLALALPACSATTSIGRKEQVLYVALGASDAFGVGAVPITNGYVYRIRDELDRQIDRVDLINLGIPGARIDQIGDSLYAFLQTGANPDIVTVWVGTNDIIAGRPAADFERVLGAMLARLREDTDAFVVIANLPDLTQLPRFRAQPSAAVTQARIRLFNDAIARQARRYDVSMADFFAQPVERQLVSDIDGFHPSNEGHARIAQLFLNVVMPAIGLTRVRVAAEP